VELFDKLIRNSCPT